MGVVPDSEGPCNIRPWRVAKVIPVRFRCTSSNERFVLRILKSSGLDYPHASLMEFLVAVRRHPPVLYREVMVAQEAEAKINLKSLSSCEPRPREGSPTKRPFSILHYSGM